MQDGPEDAQSGTLMAELSTAQQPAVSLCSAGLLNRFLSGEGSCLRVGWEKARQESLDNHEHLLSFPFSSKLGETTEKKMRRC